MSKQDYLTDYLEDRNIHYFRYTCIYHWQNPIHPYTRSLLSAIPLPNPVVEKRRVAETYDYATSGIDYSKGTSHLVSGSHYVKCTDEEFAKWCK